MTISNKETALLNLLSEGDTHAYGIEQMIEDRSMREWTEISLSSIYKLLRKLEEGGLIKSELKMSEKNVTQKVYRLTPSGKKELEDRIKSIISEPEHMIYRVDLATSHLGILSKKEAVECLEQYRTKLKDGMKCYVELEKYLYKCGCPEYGMALSQRPQYLIRGELEWVEAYLGKIRDGNELK